MSIFPTRILLATDGSEEAALAAKTAVDIAQQTGSELHVVHARFMLPWTDYSATETSTSSTVELEEIGKRVRRWLEEQVERIEAKGGQGSASPPQARKARRRIITLAEEIVTVAEEIGAGLIVTGSRGLGGIRRALMGSVSDSVVRHAHCPVLVVRKDK